MNQILFKEIIQSGHLNFLIGSGCSFPCFKTLENVENLLNEIQDMVVDEEIRSVALVSVMEYYLRNCMADNRSIILQDMKKPAKITLQAYSGFVSAVNDIILGRKMNILNKQVNVFTTNMDLLLEKALEDANIEFNDGFTGRINPYFDLSNYKKSVFKTSAHYDNVSEVSMFNIYKLHGSVNWKIEDAQRIFLDQRLINLKKLSGIEWEEDELVEVTEAAPDGSVSMRSAADIITAAEVIAFSKKHIEFLEVYEQLVIVNPTREKFKFTTLNHTYYELLRMYSNELEKENSVLLVMGLSFSDDHIREITLRAMNANPTLIVCIFAYDRQAEKQIKRNLNVHASPPRFDNLIFAKHVPKANSKDIEPYSLHNITKFYLIKLLKQLPVNSKP